MREGTDRGAGGSTGGRVGALRRPARLAPGAALAWAVLAALAGSAGARGEDAEDLVRCPVCDPKGYVPCPECKGRGEIYRPCEVCGGSGEKPCPVCTKERPNRPKTGPGTLSCTACGGKGTVGANGRVCSRCGGSGSTTCEVCLGNGTVRCRREVFVKICPRCKFLGKVPCTLCGGTTFVSRAVALTEGARATAKAEANGRGAAKPTLPSPGGASDERGEEAYAIDEVRGRYEKLAPLCEAHYDIFVEDQIPRVESVRIAAGRLKRSLELAESENEDLRAELKSLLERAESFRKRWWRLKDLFDQERRAYANMKNNWQLREEAISSLAPAFRREAEADWDRRMSILLRVLEKHAAPLQADDPSWIPEEVAALEAGIQAVEKKVAAEVAALQAATKERGPPEARKPRRGPEETVAGVAARADPRRPPDGEGEAPLASPASRQRSGEDRGAVSPPGESPDSGDTADAGSAAAEGRGSPLGSRPSRLSPLLWALVGFGAACILLVAGSRIRARLERLSAPNPFPERGATSVPRGGR